MASNREQMKNNGKYLGSWAGSATGNQKAPTAYNLARAFTPTRPMCDPGTDTDKLVVMMDVPRQLKSAIDAGMKTIGYDCLRENAKVVLQVYEDICIQHVLDHQIADKTLRKLTQRNPAIEKSHPEKAKTLAPKSRIAKSSLIGEDPYGDKSIPSLGGGDKGDGDQAEGDGGELVSEVQLLLMEIQDKNYMYLTTHVQRLLTPALYVRVKAEEMKYENDDQDVRTLSARNRMPWSRYKELVLQLLPKNTGLYETTILFSLQHEDRESAARWM